MTTLKDTTAVIVGASRGFGRAIALAAAEAEANVVALARSAPELDTLHEAHANVTTLALDATQPDVAATLISKYDPDLLVIVAGATPPMAPLHEQSWEQFSTNWNADVKLTYEWLRAALLTPLHPSGRVVVLSSGAAVAGSPLSGGYAGAKATHRFMTSYS